MNEQNDPLGNDEALASQFIRDFLRDPQRDIYEPYFTLKEVIFIYFFIFILFLQVILLLIITY